MESDLAGLEAEEFGLNFELTRLVMPDARPTLSRPIPSGRSRALLRTIRKTPPLRSREIARTLDILSRRPMLDLRWFRSRSLPPRLLSPPRLLLLTRPLVVLAAPTLDRLLLPTSLLVGDPDRNELVLLLRLGADGGSLTLGLLGATGGFSLSGGASVVVLLLMFSVLMLGGRASDLS